MKLTLALLGSRRRGQRAWALLAVMSLGAAGLLIMASVMNWSDENSSVTERNNEYFATTYAAEAATEKVLASIYQQYNDYGFFTVNQNLTTYARLIPTSADGSYWNNYQFSGGNTANRLIVFGQSNYSVPLGPPFRGMTNNNCTYEIIANAQNTNTLYQIVSTVGQQIQLSSMNLFQFAIFYQGDMEFGNNAPMTITGLVHGNANIYTDPETILTFMNDVSASGNIT